MLQELKFQLSTALLTVFTAAALIAAGLNFQQLRRFHLPDDGVVWVNRAETNGIAVVAAKVDRDSGAAQAGIRPGDVLVRINSVSIDDARTAAKVLYGLGVLLQANYTVIRRGVEVTVPIIIGESTRDAPLFSQYVTGAAYLAIGLFVYLRRGSAYKAVHFYVFCLTSFIFSCFHYSGKLNSFDWVIYWGNVVAGLLAPALLLHFCLTFPEPRSWFKPKRDAWIIYLPSAVVVAVYVGLATHLLQIDAPPVELRVMLDRVSAALLLVYFAASAVILAREHRKAQDPTSRQQLKWLRNGIVCGFLPFALLYLIPFVAGQQPLTWMRYSVLSLTLIPLTIAYAIARYRLMDVDIIFRRGFAYTAATVCVLAAFYGIVFSLGSFAQKNFKDIGNGGLLTVMLVTAFLFQPLRNWIQERLDRYFYQEKYDYRRTLIEFARELNAETDIDKMLSAIGDRVMQTLSIRHIAFFIAESPVMPPHALQFRLRKSIGSSGRAINPLELDLSFLNWARDTPYFFFERSRLRFDAVALGWPASVRQTLTALDLTYYLPCVARGREVGYLGFSKSESGEFLSSDDIELLGTLSGYVGIAIENANLYQALQNKVDEYERLKEFSENIVESISVGILAADLEDRVESWNSRMEDLTGVSREVALGRRLSELFPAALIERLSPLRQENGIHHIDKFVMRQWGAHTTNGRGGNGDSTSVSPAPVRESTFNIAVAPLISRDMERIGRLVIFDDITDRSELERQLVQADKLSSIGLLAAGVAHEVNTPLAVISTYAQMLTKQLQDDEQKSRMLDKIARQTFRASEIVNSLLNFSRTTSSETGPVQVNKVIQETLSLLEHAFEKAGVRTRLALDANLPPITGSSGKLQQVFLNLFLNARDAMEHCQPGEAWLEVTTSAGEATVKVDVCDTGHGIAPEHRNRIYDPFFTTKAARQGTGLGLSVTYGIVQEHGGTIEAFPRNGSGSRFRLELPFARKPVHA